MDTAYSVWCPEDRVQDSEIMYTVHMTHPDDAFIPRQPSSWKDKKRMRVDDIPDPKTEEGYDDPTNYLDESADDPVHPDQQLISRLPATEMGIRAHAIRQQEIGMAHLHALEGVDHANGHDDDSLQKPHDEIEAGFDKAANNTFVKRSDERVKYDPPQYQTQGHRGKEHRGKHNKGGDSIRRSGVA